MTVLLIARIHAARDDATERNALRGLRYAEQRASRLPDRLASADVIAAAPAEARFAIREGALQIPTTLGWIETPPGRAGESFLDPLLAERIRRALALPDAERVATLAQLLDDPGLDAATRAELRVAAAWAAERATTNAPDFAATRDRLLADVGTDAAALTRASAALLRARLGRPLDPAETADWLRRLPQPRARTSLDALAAQGVDTAALAEAVSTAAERRGRLRRVAPSAAALAARRRTLAERLGDALVVFDPGSGDGALLTAAECTAILDDPDVLPATGAPEGSIPALDGLLAVPLPDWSLGEDSDATALELPLAIALGTVLLGGAALAWRALRREQQALARESEFLAMVTHELKTPLAGIRLATELLADDHVVDADERRDWLRRLDGEATRLGMIVENVLDLGRAERGERAHAPEPVDLVEFVAETLTLFEPLTQRDGIELHFEPADADLAPVAIDRTALRQALLNLLENARKYGAAVDGAIEVSIDRCGDRARIAIRDHGPGVPADEREAIFTRFQRGSRHRSGQVPGVGLGLHLARQIARRHGGELALVDLPAGQSGARFELELPLGVGGTN